MNYFDIIESNKNLITNEITVNAEKSSISFNGNSFKVQDYTARKIAEAFEEAKANPDILIRLNNLFNGKVIELGEHLNNQRLLVVANHQLNNWLESSNYDDFGFATECALADLSKRNEKDDYINYLTCPDNYNISCSCFTSNGVSTFEINHYQDKSNMGLIFQANTLEEVMAKYDSRKDNIPTPIHFKSDTDIAIVTLPDGVKAEVKSYKEQPGLSTKTMYDVKFMSDGKESSVITLTGDASQLMELRDGIISFEEFGVTPANITLQSDVIQSDIRLKYDHKQGANGIQKAIVQAVNNSGDADYSKWICFESETSPFQVAFRVENPKFLEEDHNPNIELQVKHKDGSYVAQFDYLTISPDYIANILENNERFNNSIYGHRIDEEMREMEVLDIDENEVRIEDHVVRYASFVGDCIDIHMDEVKHREKAADVGLNR